MKPSGRSPPAVQADHVAAIAEQRATGAKVHPPGTLVSLDNGVAGRVDATVIERRDGGLVPYYRLRLADGSEVKRCAQRVKQHRAPAAPVARTFGGKPCAVCGTAFKSPLAKVKTCGPTCAYALRAKGFKVSNKRAAYTIPPVPRPVGTAGSPAKASNRAVGPLSRADAL